MMMKPDSSKERAALLDRLNAQRSHVLGVMKGPPRLTRTGTTNGSR
jgi:hypothetical protein